MPIIKAVLIIIYAIEISSSLEIIPQCGPELGGTTVSIKGLDFIPSTNLACSFNGTLSSIKYYNLTHIECTSPPGTGEIELWVLGLDSFFIGNFLYYPPIEILSVLPLSGSDLFYHNLNLTLPSTSSYDIWSIKIDEYSIKCSDGLICTIPPFTILQVLNPNVTNLLSLYLSRNSQQYQDSGYIFTYLFSNIETLNSFTISPTHGPKNGQTIVTVTISESPGLIEPLCKFGNIQIQGIEVSPTSFTCLSPIGSGKVLIAISANGVDFTTIGREFIYDKVEIYEYKPTQGTVSGNSYVIIKGYFMPYLTPKCKFADVVVSAIMILGQYLNCTTPIKSEGSVDLSISLNEQNYYYVGPYTYRAKEELLSILPFSGPSSGGTYVNVTMKNIYTTTGAYCRVGNTFKTKLISGMYCLMPPQSIVGSSVKLYVSSNDVDYESFISYSYYTQLTLSSISPALVTNSFMQRTYTLTGTNFINTGIISVICAGVVYSGTYISTTSMSFTVADQLPTGRVNVSVALNGQNYSPSIVYLEVFVEPVLLSVNPSFGFLKGGIKLALRGLNFLYSETIFCKFDSTDVAGSFINENLVTCLNPTQTSSKVSLVSVSFNNKYNYSNTVFFEYISTPTLPSITPTSSYNQEKVVIGLSFSPARQPLLIKTGLVWVKISTNTSPYTFTMPGHSSGSITFILTYNYLETQSGLSFTFLTECVTGKYCPVTSPYTQIACPLGHYCSGTSVFVPVPCPPGSYSLSSSSSCTTCPSLYYCPYISSSEAIFCPQGFLCTSTGNSYKAKICPSGSVCNKNIQNLCAEGSWCGLGTVYSTLYMPNDFRTGQTCHQGYYCSPGSTNAYFSLCPGGSYCQNGYKTSCPASSFCIQGANSAVLCLPGFYTGLTGQSSCSACTTGNMCPGRGNLIQVPCPPGYVCSIAARPSPYDVCPGGNYCLEGVSTNDTGTNTSPIPCNSGTYCLMGVISGDIVDGNVKYAQTCIQGTFCVQGESSPEAQPCPPGFYCPSGSSEPNSTLPGYYAQGLGNPLMQPCPAGNYSYIYEATYCDPCPAGYYCPYDKMVVPIICPAGTYRGLVSKSIYCELCPEGTYSTTPGLTSIDQCIPCDASIICLSRGLSSLTETAVCPEGYVCESGTTSSSLEKSSCPGGFWCNIKTSQPADYGICDPGFYCPTATGYSSRHQFVCLQGYYCPPATNAKLNSEGGYEFINSEDYYYVVLAKQEYNKNCTSSTDSEDTCEIKEIPTFTPCEEDARIPELLKQKYTSLECPPGTTSASGAVCVGQCIAKKDLTTIINPIISVRRALQESLQNTTLDPYHILLLEFNFLKVNPNFYYNTDFSIQLWGSDNNSLSLPSYFSSSSASFHINITISIINLGQEPMDIIPGLALHNDLFIPLISELQNTLNITSLHPIRASYGSNMLFASLLWVGSFTSIDMPYNMIGLTKSDGSPIDLWLLDTGANSEWNGSQYESPPFDTTFWVNYGINSVTFPWLPYFMNCEYFGDRIYLSRLTEAMENCTFVDERDTQYVQPLPITGVTAVSDHCEIFVKCFYAEYVQTTASTRWFEINQEEVLYYLTRYPQDPSVFESTMNSVDSSFTQQIVDQADTVVQVKFSPSGYGSGIPTLVTMNIAYYQKDSKTKLLVSADIVLSLYSTLEMESESPGYLLNINFYPLGWFDLLNKFQFSLSIYIILFVLICFLLFALGYSVYFAHIKFVRDPPEMHFRFYLWVSSLPPTIGVVFASLPIVIVVYSLQPLAEAFSGVSGDWAVEAPLAPEAVTQFLRGRIGMCMAFVSFSFFVYGSRLLIPKPDPPEEEEEGAEGEEGGEDQPPGEENGENADEKYGKIKKIDEEDEEEENQEDDTHAANETVKNEEETKKPDEGSEGQDDEDDENENNEEDDDDDGEDEPEEEEEPEFPMWDAMKMKRRFFMLGCLAIAVISSIKLEISYSQTFSSNIFAFQVAFSALDVFLYQVFSRLVFSEALLVVPVLTSLFINKSIMMLASPNFTIFMECYVLNFAFIILERLYISPFIEFFEQKLQQTAIHLVAKSIIFKKLFGNMVLAQLLETKKLMSHMKGNSDSGEKNDRMMGTMVRFSAQSQATFMLPLVYLFISLLADATQIPKNYGIKQSDVNYYLLFSLLVIIPQLLLDVYMLHLIESLYGYKLFDYLTYCSYRFSTRANWWKYELGVPLDKSLLPTWRSIDNMCFSSQFYFSVTLASWGVVCLTLGFTIMIRNAFNPCGDPLIISLALLIRYIGVVLKKFFIFIRPHIKLWVPRPHPIFVDEIPQNDSDDQIVELIDEYAIENELLHKIQTDVFKAKFLKKNVAFLVENLEKIIESNQQCHNYLKERYYKLYDLHLKEEKDRHYIGDRLELLQLLPNNKFNPDFEVSFEREPFERPIVKKILPQTEKIARNWLSQAKLFVLLKKSIEDESILQESCEICEMTEHLKAVTQIPFETIYTLYKETYKGYPLKLSHWKKFYFRNQEIKTLCVDCAYLEQLKKKNDPRAFCGLTRIALEQFSLVKSSKPTISKATESIARKWLEIAKENLGNDIENYGELFTIESVSEQDLSAVVSQLEEPNDEYF